MGVVPSEESSERPRVVLMTDTVGNTKRETKTCRTFRYTKVPCVRLGRFGGKGGSYFGDETKKRMSENLIFLT